MPKTTPFDLHVQRYEDWFAKYPLVYDAELRAIESLLPNVGTGAEIGVGTGRFAAPLGIKVGLEPSIPMGEIAQSRGIKVIGGVAEELPFRSESLGFVLMVTTVCFLDDIVRAFHETYRVLCSGGSFVVGLVDKESPLGKLYLNRQQENVFYREATFFSVDEIVDLMEQCGFGSFEFRQTIFRNLFDIIKEEPVDPGYGKGSFVAVRGEKDHENTFANGIDPKIDLL